MKASTSPSTPSAPTTCNSPPGRGLRGGRAHNYGLGHIPGNVPTVEGLQRKLEPLSFWRAASSQRPRLHQAQIRIVPKPGEYHAPRPEHGPPPLSLLRFVALCLLSLAPVLPSTPRPDKRVALVIGNGAYRNVPTLANPTNDAADIGAALKRSGFEPRSRPISDQAAMQDTVLRFAREARGADVALPYYSGHALHFAGVNHLRPSMPSCATRSICRRLVRADEILADLQQAKNLRILVARRLPRQPLRGRAPAKHRQGRGRNSSAAGWPSGEPGGHSLISYATAGRSHGRRTATAATVPIPARSRRTSATGTTSIQLFQTISAGVQQPPGSQVP